MTNAQVVAYRNPFNTLDRKILPVGAGSTLIDILEALDIRPSLWQYAHICLNGCPIAPDTWATIRVEEGDSVALRIFPSGGDGGGRKVLGIVIAIAAVAASALVLNSAALAGIGGKIGSGATAISVGQLAGLAAVNLVAGLALTALSPPPDLAEEEAINPSPQLTGIRNQVAQFAPIPRIFGKHRIYPQFATVPFTEVEGEKQYLRCLFCCGYGELDIPITEMRIGETPLNQYDEVDVTVYNDFVAGDATTTTTTFLVFDGSTTFVEVADDTILDKGATITSSVGQRWTWEVRCRTDEDNDGKTYPLVHKGKNYRIWIDTDRAVNASFFANVTNTSGNSAEVEFNAKTNDGAIKAGIDYRISVVYSLPHLTRLGPNFYDNVDGSAGEPFIRIFIDGDQHGEMSGDDSLVWQITARLPTISDAVDGTDALLFGKDAEGTPNYFKGRIRDMRLWNHKRSLSDIRDNLNATLLGTETGLQGYWKLTETSTGAIDDAEKRKSISGIPFLIPGVTPDATPDPEWRVEAAWGYSAITPKGQTVYDITTYANNGHVTGVVWETVTTENVSNPFSRIIFEDSPGIPLHNRDNPHVRTTREDTEEISIDIAFLSGIFDYDSDGINDYTQDLSFTVDYKLSTDSTWINWDDQDFTIVDTADSSKDSIQTRKILRVSANRQVTKGKYDVRIQRDQADNDTDADKSSVAHWTAFRSIRHESPVNLSNLALVALRIKATDQLQGILDTFNCVCYSRLNTYDGSSWSTAYSTNPAWAMVEVLTGDMNGRPLLSSANGDATERLDLTGLKEWADSCELQITLTSVTAGQTIEILGLTFTAHATTTTVASQEFDISGTDAADATELKTCLDDTSNGIGDWATITASSNTLTIIPKDIKQRISATNIQADGTKASTFRVVPAKQFNAKVDFRSTALSLISNIASVGRASPDVRDTLFSVARDKIQTSIIQHFTPRNSWGYEGEKTFREIPHALKVNFNNEDTNFQQDEVIVYRDLYSELGGQVTDPFGVEKSTTAATKFETLNLFGVTNSKQAWIEGRYHIADGILRPELHRWDCDIENLVCQRGDLIRFTHDVPSFGEAYGRIKTVTLNGADASGVTLDDEVTMVAGNSYTLRFRRGADSTSENHAVDTVAGTTSSLTFTTDVTAADIPAVGDLYQFGQVDSESVEMIVKEIEAFEDLSARLTVVDHATAVHDSDIGIIPDFDSQISQPPDPETRKPPIPQIIRIISDESVAERQPDGSIQLNILLIVNVEYTENAQVIQQNNLATFFHVNYKRSGTSEPWTTKEAVPNDVNAGLILLPVLEVGPSINTDSTLSDVKYDIRIRSVNRVGAVSDWAESLEYPLTGLTRKPPDVGSIVMAQGNVLMWDEFYRKPIDFAGFRVKYHAGDNTHWGSGVTMHNDLIKENHFQVRLGSAIQYTFMVKAVDFMGNESATAASVKVTVTDEPWAETQQGTYDYQANDWPGVLVNCTKVGSSPTFTVDADSATDLWEGDGIPLWDATDTTLLWGASYDTMIYEAIIDPDDVNGSQWPIRVKVTQTIVGRTHEISYRKGTGTLSQSDTRWDDDETAVAGDTDPYLPWPGYLDVDQTDDDQAGFRYRIKIMGGSTQGQITAMDAFGYKPDAWA